MGVCQYVGVRIVGGCVNVQEIASQWSAENLLAAILLRRFVVRHLHADMTLYVARTQNNNKQIFARLARGRGDLTARAQPSRAERREFES